MRSLTGGVCIKLLATLRYKGALLSNVVLTAARTGEVVGARWSEIDLETDTWIIPAARMKARREHRVPLSPRAVELLSRLYREDGNSHVFIGARTGDQTQPVHPTGLTNPGKAGVAVNGIVFGRATVLRVQHLAEIGAAQLSGSQAYCGLG